MNKKSVLWFSEIDKLTEEAVGEKAYYLAEAYNRKLLSKRTSIPNGFVITKETITDFLEKNGITNAITNITEDINTSNEEELKRAESQIKDLILRSNFEEKITEEINDSYETLGANKVEIERGSAYDILSTSIEPIFVAVRSSNEENEGDSFFNIKGNPGIISAIKKILISIFTKENLKNKKEITKKTTAIIIQKMIQGDKSGIAISDDKLLIESIWGMGNGLNQKEIEKDQYTIRRDGKILNKILGDKKYAITRDSSGNLRAVTLKEGYSKAPTLDDSEIQELSDMNLRLETIFNKKTNFHFTIEDDEIFIVTINEPKNKTERKEITKKNEVIEEKEITNTIKKAEEIKKIELENKPEEKSQQIQITPIENLTKTKLELFIETKSDNEKGEKTLLKNGILTLNEIIKERGIHPIGYIQNFNTKGYEEVLTSGLHENANHLKEVWVKLSDFTTKEFKELQEAPDLKEENPMLGLCGIRFLLSNPELLKRELKAIHSLSIKKQVGILIPKISSVYELKKVKEYIKNLEINIKVGIILETPASIQLIKDFIEEGIDAAIFAGDTLTQYLLAIDKENKPTKEFYDDTNPALMYQLEYVIRVCKRQNIKTGFFGETLNKKEMVEYLVKKHIDSIITKPEIANKIHEEITIAEEKFVEGTDKEPRQYEKNKEKERQQKEIEEFEKIKEEQIKTEILPYTKKEEIIKINPETKKEKPQKTTEEYDYNPEEFEEITEEIEEFENTPENLDDEILEIENKNLNNNKQTNDFDEEEELVEEDIIEIPKVEDYEEFFEDEKEK